VAGLRSTLLGDGGFSGGPPPALSRIPGRDGLREGKRNDSTGRPAWAANGWIVVCRRDRGAGGEADRIAWPGAASEGRKINLTPFLLLDKDGNITTSYVYDAFGKVTKIGNDQNPFQYTGRENDGTGLYYYRARYYSPHMRRFISEDPLRIRGGWINFYNYARNNPITYFDPLGLSAKRCQRDCEQELNDCGTHAVKNDVKCTLIVGGGAGIIAGGCSLACLFTGPALPICVGGCGGAGVTAGEAGTAFCQALILYELNECLDNFNKRQIGNKGGSCGNSSGGGGDGNGNNHN